MEELKYEFKNIEFDKLLKTTSMPSYQRRLVWDSNQKQTLINTVMKGEPFGFFLLYNKGTNREPKYLLIDGLQRFSTLKDFRNKPCSYISCEEIIKEDIDKILSAIISTGDINKHHNSIVNFINKNLIFDEVYNNPMTFINQLLDEFSFLKSDINIVDNIKNHFSQSLSKILNYCDIRYLSIPTLEYIGDFNSLPIIFKNLNTNATKLSTSDILASIWSQQKITIYDEDLLKIVDEFYKEKINEVQIEIDGYTKDQMIKSKELTLYELCLAFGKLLSKNFDIIFKKNNFIQLGILLLCGILNKNTNSDKISELDKFFINDLVKPNFISYLKEALVESFKLVEDILEEYILENTTKNGRNILCNKFSEAQLLSIVITAFNINYTVIEKNSTLLIIGNEKCNLYLQNFKKYMPFKVLYDTLDGAWDNSSDKTLTTIISTPLDNNIYCKKISKESWENQLKKWIREEMQKMPERKSFKTQLFLIYIHNIYNKIYNISINHNIEFSEIISSKKIEKLFGSKKGFSLLGNMTYIKKGTSTTCNMNNSFNSMCCPREDCFKFLKENKPEFSKYITFVEKRNSDLINQFLDFIRELKINV